ncbi:helix-turn-helix domain-containing protein [Crossiella sp. CA198]|uniref:helix-turn-helix domain-containing protein n=1 Tax=Crossiella sp. CA198 TaxID=3455607 RepID=UPI003F8D8966
MVAELEHKAGLRLRAVARQLVGWRDRAGLTGTQLAAKLGISAATVSRNETASTPIKPVTVLAWGMACGIDGDERDKWFSIAQRLGEPQWWHGAEMETLNQGAQDFAELESEASLLCIFRTEIVPSLLQTKDYRLAVIKSLHPPVSEEAAQQRVDATATRSQRLYGERRLDLKIVLLEAVLHGPWGSPAVRREQLQRLVQFAQLPNVEIRVIRQGVPYSPADSPFTLLSFEEDHFDDVVSVDNLQYVFNLENDAVRPYKIAFAGLQSVALSPAESVDLISAIADDIELP